MVPPFVGPISSLGFPAPFWFIWLFKVLGFSLHMVPMNLWYAGMISLLILRWLGNEHARRLSDRILKAMPIIVAIGINLGIVPLLFTQVAYYQAFYPSTILMAWPWFSVIPLLMVAYYGVYIYVIGLGHARLTPARKASGWLAAVLFVVIGFVFANNFSLMTNLGAWGGLYQSTNVAGAPLGIALDTAQPSLWPRWLMMFGLALTTTAAYVVVDTGFFAGGESDEYRHWARRLALVLYTVGLAWFALSGTWYFFGTLAPTARAAALSSPILVLTLATALSPGLPWILILAGQRRLNRNLAAVVGLAQYGVLAANALSRQIVQDAELGAYLDVRAQPVNVEWSPLILFLLLFVGGLGLVAWMIRQFVISARHPADA